MAIFKDITITVKENTATLSDNIYLYLGDGGITLLITLIQNNCKFGNFKSGNSNIIEEAEAKWASVCVEKPNGDVIVSDKCEIWDDKLRFEVTKEFVDEVSEAGTHKLQIHLYDSEYKNGNRYTIPPVEVNVLEPLCSYESKTIINTNFYKKRTLDGTDFSNLFHDYRGDSLDFLVNWDVSKVIYMDFIFSGCRYITEANLGNWETSSLRSCKDMFYGCSELEKVDMRNWNINLIMSGLFYNCDMLHTIRLDNCNDYTLKSILVNAWLPTGLVNGETRKIYCNEEAFNKANITITTEGWEVIFVN